MKHLILTLRKLITLPKSIQIVILRFARQTFLIGVTGIIFNDNNEVLLFKHSYRAHPWSLPGGYVKSGEHPAEALEREIKEESQLIVSADEVLHTRTDRLSARLDMCCMGILIGGVFTPSHEVSEYGFFSQDTMPLLRSNQVFLIDEAIKIRNTVKTVNISGEKEFHFDSI